MARADALNTVSRPRARRRRWPIVLGVFLAAIVLLILLWDWSWFRPLVEAQASVALGRKVTVGHFDLHLSRHPVAVLDDVTIANPDGFSEAAPYLVHADRLAVTADAMAYLHGRRIVLPRIEVDRPDAHAIRLADGRTNYALSLGGSSSGPGAEIGKLVINDGHAHVADPKLKADFKVAVATKEGQGDAKDEIAVSADGTYAGQPIAAQAVGGALLSLRDASSPYPIDAHLQNGPTKLDLTGTVQDPLHFKGTNLKLHLAGPDMSLLTPLVGFPLPRTPNFDLAGQLDYADRKIRLTEFRGKVGGSDLAGTIAVDPAGERPVVTLDLRSKRVDLADLGGFVGSEPGRVSTPGQTAEQKQQVAKAEASSQFLPTKKISVPQIKAADFHVTYKGESIVGRGIPFDSLSASLDIANGTIKLHPISLGVGRGSIAGDVTLAPASEEQFHVTSDIRFDRVDVGRLLNATGMVKGAGLLGGRAELDSTGNSMANLIGRGDGSVRLMMAGGNLSALLVNLSGLQFGNALLSALGIPTRATLDCFVADLALQKGKLETKTLLAVTSEADIKVDGSVDLVREALAYRLRTEARHLSVGSLPADIGIGGTLKHPTIMPNLGEIAARGGAAVALGVLLTPLGALLPTVQFGTGDENANVCAAVIRANGKRPNAASAATPPPKKVAKKR